MTLIPPQHIQDQSQVCILALFTYRSMYSTYSMYTVSSAVGRKGVGGGGDRTQKHKREAMIPWNKNCIDTQTSWDLLHPPTPSANPAIIATFLTLYLQQGEVCLYNFMHSFHHNLLPLLPFNDMWQLNRNRQPERELRNADQLYIPPHRFATFI
jgi:hypothetical protein